MKEIRSDQFIFHERLNATFLGELFEGDTIYAETVFEDFLRDLPAYWERVQTSFQHKDLRLLGTNIHTCKTLFGYVGFTDLQELCQEFENKCGAGTAEELLTEFDTLQKKKQEAQDIIENEYSRLKRFNAGIQ
jgi:HPt (histidine-containing phosphotransfer) domain-containing protein